jgi:hypothetical protein
MPCLGRLGATLLILNLQGVYNTSDVHTDALLQLLHTKLLPKPNAMPSTTREAKKLLSTIGLALDTIHACPTGCVLYRKDFTDLTECPMRHCGLPRYRPDTIGDKIPEKVWQCHGSFLYVVLQSNASFPVW